MTKRSALENALSLGGYLIVALLYMLPLPLHWTGYIPGDNGDSVPNLWPFWYFPHELATGVGSLFHTPLEFFPDGISLIYASNSAVGATLMAPLAWLISPAAALNTWLLLHIWLGGWFFFKFCRLLGAGRCGAWLGGFAYACSPFVAVHLPGHYTLVQIVYTSGALLALGTLTHRCVAADWNWRRGIFPSAALALCCWAVAITDLYLAVMTLFLLLIALIHFILERKGLLRSRSFWMWLAGAAVFTTTLLLPWVFLILNAKHGHDYSALDLSMGSKNVVRWSRLVTFPAYHSVWEPIMFPVFMGKLSIFNEWTYLGMVGLFIAAVGLLYVRPVRRVPFAWIAGFLIALGLAGANRYTLEPAWTSGPLSFGRWWPASFPFSEFRVPGRWHFVLCVTLAVGIAIGSDALFSKLQTRRRGLAFVVIFALMAFDLLRWPLPICRGSPLDAGILSADERKGTVLDVPVGVISGQGHYLGHYVKATLLRQMSHGRPILSANVSRLPNDIVAKREQDPELSAFLATQAGDAETSEAAILDWPGFRERYNITTVRIPLDWPTSHSLLRIADKLGSPEHWQRRGDSLIGTIGE